MTEEQFDLIITALHYIEFGIGFIAGILIARLITDIILKAAEKE